MRMVSELDYLKLLAKWLPGATESIYDLKGHDGIAFYGTGDHGHWSLQTNNNAFAAFAVASCFPELESCGCPISCEEARAIALKLFRFTVHTHLSGELTCVDGLSWGHSWISVLGLERMMHGVQAIDEYLTDADQQAFRRVLISESNWLMDEYDIVADPDNKTGKNKPESNIWNGALLLRTAMYYPDCERVDEYIEKGTKFILNGISIPADAESDQMYDGRPLSEWHVGGNFYNSFSLNHHGYMNVGYMVICLSNLAMLYFTYRDRGVEPPAALFHHVKDLWNVVKLCTFSDGRLMRVGGDTRMRYCYCQDYAVPSWLFMRDIFGDKDTLQFESGWMAHLAREMEASDRGVFLDERLGDLYPRSPLYFHRLEADKASTVSMAACWHRRFKDIGENADTSETAFNGRWFDQPHGVCLSKSTERIASWVWEAAEKPQGLVLPGDGSDLAEWRTNLAGRIEGVGLETVNEILEHHETEFPGGFITAGELQVLSRAPLAEGDVNDKIAKEQLVMAALPDNATVVILQRGESLVRTHFRKVLGLMLQIPNDLFNSFERHYYSAEGEVVLNGNDGIESDRKLESDWLNVENRLGVIRLNRRHPFGLYHSGDRQIGLASKVPKIQGSHPGALAVDEICSPASRDLEIHEQGELFQVGFILRPGLDAKATAGVAASIPASALIAEENGSGLNLTVPGADGRNYNISVNWSDLKSASCTAV